MVRVVLDVDSHTHLGCDYIMLVCYIFSDFSE